MVVSLLIVTSPIGRGGSGVTGSGVMGTIQSQYGYVPVELVNAGISKVPVEFVIVVVELNVCASASPMPNGINTNINATIAIHVNAIDA